MTQRGVRTTAMTSSNVQLWRLLVTCMLCVLSDVMQETEAALAKNHMYVSNATHILSINTYGRQAASSVYSAPTGSRIVGLAYSLPDGLLFWSDISRINPSIYCAATDNSGNLINVTQIVKSGVFEVNGLTVDWISKHIYWTDSRKRTIEVAEFNGTNRRILFLDLNQPRGIYADPVNKYLFWNDQGSHIIERSRLDGSSRVVLIDNTSLPNQMVVYDRKLYWVDSGDKTLRRIDVAGGSNMDIVQLNNTTGNNHVFGLAINGATAFITCWSSEVQVLSVDLNSHSVSVIMDSLGSSAIFSAVFVSDNVQNTVANPCASSPCKQGQLCLPTSSSYRCSCPSFGGKTLNAATKECQTPTNVLLYTLADSGFVGFYDPVATPNGDFYLIGRSSRPVAVTYDPVNQDINWYDDQDIGPKVFVALSGITNIFGPISKMVYWSDVYERNIRRSKLDGTLQTVILGGHNGIGIVDGMAMDHAGRRLIYSNIGSVKIEDKYYSWHKVESVNVDRSSVNVKTLISSIADKPRAIAIDVDNAVFYYTDWGSKASIVKANLDGTNATVLKTGLSNPNGIVLVKGKLYVVDSNYKTRTSNLGRVSDGSLYSMDTDGNNWSNVLPSVGLKIPYGVTSNGGNLVFISDWDSKRVVSYDVTSRTSQTPSLIVSGSSPMALHYTAVTLAAPSGRSPDCSSCSDVCLRTSTRSSICTCDSYKGKAYTGNSCSVPSGYLAVSDMDGVKIVSLDNTADKSVYVAAAGRPYYSNFVGLVLDEVSNIAYYSDLATKTINALNMINSTSTEFYHVNHVIDGITLHRGVLYWTDSRNGLIASLDTKSNSVEANRTHTTLVYGLSRPRAIKVFDSYIYWTEWGDKPRVCRTKLYGPFIVEPIIQTGLKWPNGLFMYLGRMFVADGHPSKRQLLNCSLVGECQSVSAVNNAVVKHIYDLQIVNNVMYYSDWNTSTISVLSLDNTGTPLQPIAAGLMRPSQFHFFKRSNTQGSTSSRCSSSSVTCSSTGSCIQLLGSQQCLCNRDSSFNGHTCVSDQSAMCGSYSVGQVFKPTNQACVTCQCLANRFYADNNNHRATCTTVQCPTLKCIDSVRRDGECCPVCPDAPKCSAIRITNCNSSVTSVPLPASSSRVVFVFEPTYDCLQPGQNVRVTRDYVNNLFDVGSYTLRTTVSVEESVSDTCQLTLNVVDNTPPVIRCPNTVRLYTDSYSVNTATAVKWQAPEVSDNSGSRVVVTSTPARGSNFTVGDNLVTYTVTDSSQNAASCQFTISVTKPPQPQSGKDCPIPRLEHGQIICRVEHVTLVCSIVCDPNFVRSSRTIVGDLTCSNGIWDRIIPDNFESFTCLRVVAGTATGDIKLIARGVCADSLNVPYTDFRLKMQVGTRFQTSPPFPLRYQVESQCSASTTDLEIAVTISGDYQNESDKTFVEAYIDHKLSEIKFDFLRGFLELFVKNDTNVWSVPVVSVTTVNTKIGCPAGSYLEPNVGCFYCPAGTYASDSLCQPCEKGRYSEREGQVECNQCPEGKTTNSAGASHVDLCFIDSNMPYNEVSDKKPPPDFNLVLIGGGVGLLVIIVIIVILVVVVRRKNDQIPRSSAVVESSIHANKMFYGEKDAKGLDDNTYDEIPGDSSQPAAATENSYQTLPHNIGAVSNNDNMYEKIGVVI